MNRTTSATAATLALAAVVLAATPAEAVSLQSAALNVARAQKGDPYSPGGAGPSRFDCSGLVYYSYRQSGRTLARTAQAQYNGSYKVSPSNRRPGDLVFIGYSAGSIYHAGIYTGWRDGRGWMVNANSGSYRGRKVVEAPLAEYTAGSPRAFYGRY